MRIGRIGQTEIGVHPLLFLVLTAACVLGRLNELLQALIALSLHEASHAIVSDAFGCRVHALELMPFGAVARVELRRQSGHAELCIAAAGPVASLLIAGMTAMCGYLFPRTAPQTAAFLTFNLVLAAINLFPALPLDGGRILRALLRGRLTRHAATTACSWLGIGLGTALLGLTVYCALRGVYNLTFPTMGIFLVLAAVRELRLMPEAEVRAYAGRFDALKNGEGCRVQHIAVHASVSAGEAMRILRRDQYNVLRVVDGDLRLLGELDEGALIAGIAKRGPETTLSELLVFDRTR